VTGPDEGGVATWLRTATPEEIERRIMVAEILAETRGQALEGLRARVLEYLGRERTRDAAEAFRDLAQGMLEDLERMEPAALYGQQRRADLVNVSGNRKGRHKIDPGTLRRAVRTHPRFGKPDQWSSVCEEVGQAQDPKMSGKQVRRILDEHHPDTKW